MTTLLLNRVLHLMVPWRQSPFLMVSPRLFALNSSGSPALGVQTWGWISKHEVRSDCGIRQRSPGHYRGLRNVIREQRCVSAPWGPWGQVLLKYDVFESPDLRGWMVLWYLPVLLPRARHLHKSTRVAESLWLRELQRETVLPALQDAVHGRCDYLHLLFISFCTL